MRRTHAASRPAHPSGPGRDAGQAAVLLIGSVVVVVAVALAFLVPLGSFVVDDREAAAAADAAALAAVGAWRDGLRDVHTGMSRADDDEEFYGPVGRGLSTFLPGHAQGEAARYAARNGAELIGYSVDGARGTITVRVRSTDVVPGTSRRAEASATAGLRFAGGLCMSAGRLGVLLGGTCRTAAPPPPPPEPEPSPTPDPSESPTPTPTPPPPPYTVPRGFGVFAVEPVLTTP